MLVALSALCLSAWWVLRGSNSRPTPCKGAALPTELSTRIDCHLAEKHKMFVTTSEGGEVYSSFFVLARDNLIERLFFVVLPIKNGGYGRNMRIKMAFFNTFEVEFFAFD